MKAGVTFFRAARLIKDDAMQAADEKGAIDEERRLARACLAGDLGAFEELLAGSERVVRGMLMNLMHNTAEAEEIAQDSFVTAYERLRQFRGDSRFSTWVCRIALNKYRDRRRIARRETDDNGVADTPADSAGEPESACLRGERARRLQRTLSRLKREDREVLAFRYLCGYRYETIAVILQCTAETARARCARAKHHLQRLLTEWSNDDVWT